MKFSKKCPFRKKYVRTDYNLYGNNGVPVFDYKENFQVCIGDECMAYYTYGDYDCCKLMKKEE